MLCLHRRVRQEKSMDQNEVEQLLLNIRSNWSTRDTDAIRAALTSIKFEAIAKLDEIRAKHLWILQGIFEAQTKFVSSFMLCKEKKFYDGWCSLERAEIEVASLKRHYSINNQYALDFIEKFTTQFQTLFPYKIFMSPEFVKMVKKCSICKKQISFRNPCGHKVGEIYMGEVCGRIVENIELAAVAIVENPVQKYSVPFISDGNGGQRDLYDYTLIEYAVSALASPFHVWSYTETQTWHPHDKFNRVGRNDLCPCQSQPPKKYKKCCLPKPGILRPHFQFKFEETPPAGFDEFKYSY